MIHPSVLRFKLEVKLDSEADVQDAVYLMLRLWIRDLVGENPTDKIASRFVIKDFISQQLNTIIEAKFIRDRDHGRSISKELHDDIEMYRHHPSCRNIIFFIYDRDALIPDQGALRSQIEVPRLYGERSVTCHLIVKP